MPTPYPRSYRKDRAKILAGNPLCYLCGVNPATTADHVIPISQGGTHSIENLRPACHPCNSGKKDNPRVGKGGYQAPY